MIDPKFIIPIYFCTVSLISIIVTAIDKRSAKRNGCRIRESTLIILSILGGSAAMFIMMLLIHHKTRHLKFMVGIPIIIFLQIVILCMLWKYFPLF